MLEAIAFTVRREISFETLLLAIINKYSASPFEHHPQK